MIEYDLDPMVDPDPATAGAAVRAAADGRDRFLLLAVGSSGGTLTYGTIFVSAAALSDEADLLRRLGQRGRLYVLTAGASGTDIRPLERAAEEMPALLVA